MLVGGAGLHARGGVLPEQFGVNPLQISWDDKRDHASEEGKTTESFRIIIRKTMCHTVIGKTVCFPFLTRL